MTKKLLTTTGIFLFLSGCVSLTPSQLRQIDELEARGYDVDYPEKRINPNAVTAMNVFFGIGNMYLAMKAPKYSGSQAAMGVLNMVTWPLSTLWAPYQGYVDTVAINRERTLNEINYGSGPRRGKSAPYAQPPYQPQQPQYRQQQPQYRQQQPQYRQQQPQYRQYPSQGYGNFYNGSYY